MAVTHVYSTERKSSSGSGHITAFYCERDGVPNVSITFCAGFWRSKNFSFDRSIVANDREDFANRVFPYYARGYLQDICDDPESICASFGLLNLFNVDDKVDKNQFLGLRGFVVCYSLWGVDEIVTLKDGFQKSERFNSFESASERAREYQKENPDEKVFVGTMDEIINQKD